MKFPPWPIGAFPLSHSYIVLYFWLTTFMRPFRQVRRLSLLFLHLLTPELGRKIPVNKTE